VAAVPIASQTNKMKIKNNKDKVMQNFVLGDVWEVFSLNFD
jgi:hypothetical protein